MPRLHSTRNLSKLAQAHRCAGVDCCCSFPARLGSLPGGMRAVPATHVAVAAGAESPLVQRMAAAFGKPRSERLAVALAQSAQAKTRSLPWALSILDGVYADLEVQVRPPHHRALTFSLDPDPTLCSLCVGLLSPARALGVLDVVPQTLNAQVGASAPRRVRVRVHPQALTSADCASAWWVCQGLADRPLSTQAAQRALAGSALSLRRPVSRSAGQSAC